ncbi:Trk system potassium transporter TrkA [Pontiella sulfatireligans]|uniref:Trk system potassium uptake protein TrkA n=1 Tax=Pontiella sulfatireligans TaxID=2750658 RepID=A0A6C2USZ2_9BACT|nr:Trk system potassium transporter TrkA [Pontiella sulfatireligans]VGO23083.1 Trk system potassium uptake protein TrkA [Pontiella sulfatireligans]
MRIVIIGAGNAGRQLAKRLCEEKHSIVMIDVDPQALAQAEAGLDILTFCGRGSNPVVLAEAQTEKSDLLIAVTDNDEVNILACLFAHHAGVKGKIARVTNPSFLQASSSYDLQQMGIDLVINQKQECAREVFNMLQMPGALEAFELFSGKVMVAGFSVNAVSPLLGRTPAECDRLDLIQSVRVIAIRREDELVVPHGNTVFEQNDIVYLVGQRPDITTFFDWVCPDIKPFEKVIIAGGGDLGLMLAKYVESEIDCVLLEQDEERARFCSAELNKTLVLRADALTESALVESGLHESTAFVALTGDDEGNIMNCLMAQKKGAAFTATQIMRTDFIPVVEQLYLVNRVVSPYISTANAILHWLRSKKARAASLLHNLPGELLDVVIAPNGKVDGRRIHEIKMPSNAIIATVMRNGEVATATGDLELQTGDRVLIFCHPDAVKKIQSIFL